MGEFPMLAVWVDTYGFVLLGAGFGAALVTMASAKAISHLASAAVENQARQPEAAGRIFTTVIIAASLIEGFTFFALVVCMQLGGQFVAALKVLHSAGEH